MNDPLRVLKKILAPAHDAELFLSVGEPLELVVELLREVQKCRKVRQRLRDIAGIDTAVSPQVFYNLLDIGEIDRVETFTRGLEMNVASLKESRTADDVVSIGNLNTVLRELYRDLDRIRQLMLKDYPNLLLVSDMSPELPEKVRQWIVSIRGLDWKVTGYWLTGWLARSVESEFRAAFPRSEKAHALREVLPVVERELGFYQECPRINGKWAAMGLDVFRILRADALSNVNQNIEELGNGLWNLVYKSPRVKTSLELAGIRFNDARSLFENDRVV